MKKKLALVSVVLVAILAVVVLSGCVTPQSTSGGVSLGENLTGLQVNMNSQQGVWVNGEGKVKVVPDVASLSLGISVQRTSVAEAQSLAAQTMDKVMAALTTSGIGKQDIQTQQYSISQVTRWDNQSQQEVVTGYRVSNMVAVKIKKIETAGAVIDAVGAAGGDYTRINGINFSVSDPLPYVKEAREKAFADAKAKAEQMANLAGISLGKPVYISESSYVPQPRYDQAYKMVAGAAPAAETSISPGETEITVNVQIAYAIK